MPEEQFTVGEGIRYEMARHGDTPASHEVYFDPNASLAYGAKFVYFYNAADGKVRVVSPKDPGR